MPDIESTAHGFDLWFQMQPKGTSPPHRIVSMVMHQERYFVATERHVYELIDGVWCPMVFIIVDAAPNG